MSLQYFDERRPLQPPIGYVRDLSERNLTHAPHIEFVRQYDLSRDIATDDIPIPAPHDREGYFGDDHFRYWISGLVEQHRLSAFSSPSRYLDFGGCTGRVARHFVRDPDCETWVCDINVNYIDWLELHAPAIRALHTRPIPALPFDSGYFDLISCFSVFTHISESALHYVLELKRVIRPGGCLYLTVLDESSWTFTRDTEWLLRSIARTTSVEKLRADLSAPLPERPYIVRYNDAEAYNCNVFYCRDTIERLWGRHFSRCEIFPMASGYQTGVVLIV